MMDYVCVHCGDSQLVLQRAEYCSNCGRVRYIIPRRTYERAAFRNPPALYVSEGFTPKWSHGEDLPDE